MFALPGYFICTLSYILYTVTILWKNNVNSVPLKALSKFSVSLFLFCSSDPLKLLSTHISPTLVLEEAENPLSKPLFMMSVSQSWLSSLSHGLRVGTFRRPSKCESAGLLFFSVVYFHFWSNVRFSLDLCSYFLACSGVPMTMSWPCAQTCTQQSTRSGFTSGSGTQKLASPTASLSLTWWRGAVCIHRVWNHSCTLRGMLKRMVLDGNAQVQISNTTRTAVR